MLYDEMDGFEMANQVRRRAVSPVELLDEAWSRTERLNGDLNAVAWSDIGRARDAIATGLPTGPFQGVPMLVKDIMATVKGFRSTSGCRAFKENVATEDTELVSRLRSAGFVIFGMTTTPEAASSPSCEAKIYGGPTRNPWNRDRSSGGSSGGAAAAVAAGILPLAHASDGGGSIRTPASACGLFGLKPTRGRNPMGPKLGEFAGGTAVEHAVTRSVRDSAALLDWTQGADPGAPYAAPSVKGSYLDATLRDPDRLRIGLMLEGPLDFPVHDDCEAAVLKTARLCEAAGHVVEPFVLNGIDFNAIFELQVLMGAVGAGGFVRMVETILGRRATLDDVEHTTLDAAQRAERISAVDYARALAAIHSVGRRMAAAMQGYDAILTPALLRPPALLGEFDTDGAYLDVRGRVARYVGYLLLANYAGLPAMSVPLHWNAAGLPIGSHFIGQFGSEPTLFALAAQLERVEPWFNVRPPVSVN